MKRLLIMVSIFALASCSSIKKVTKEKPEVDPKAQLASGMGNLPQPTDENKEYSSESIILLIEAGKEKALGNDKRAMAFYLQALEADPENDAAHFELAKMYDATDNSQKALIHAERASSIDGSNKWYLDFYANMLIANGQSDKGIDVIQKLVAQYPKDIDYLYDLAYAYQQASRGQEAIDIYEKIESLLGTTDPGVVFRKHRLLAELGKIKEAAAEVERLIESNPNEIRYIGYLAEFYELNGMPGEAVKQYDRLLKAQPGNPQALIAKVDLYRYVDQPENFEEALSDLLDSKQLSLDDKVKVLYPMVDNISEAKKYEQSYINAAQKLTKKYPNEAKAYALYGDFLYNSNNVDEAIPAYEKATELRSDVFSVWEQLMYIHSGKNDFESLATVSAKALKNFPEEGLPHYMNGFANYQLKNFDKTIEVLTKGVKLEKNTNRIAAEMYSLMGDSYHAQSQYSSSDESYDNALIRDPDNTYVLNNYSYYLSLRGENLEKAEKMIARAVELAPKEANFLDTYAWVMFKKGNFEDALPVMERALGLERNNPTLIEHYGDILFKLGRKADAVKKWEEAIEMGKANEILQRKFQDKQYYEY